MLYYGSYKNRCFTGDSVTLGFEILYTSLIFAVCVSSCILVPARGLPVMGRPRPRVVPLPGGPAFASCRAT